MFKIISPYQTFGTVTNPATVTMSIGLLAFALLSWFLHRYLDNFIVTRKSCPLTGTVQKHMPTPTQTATPHTTGPLAKMCGMVENIRLPTLQVILITVTRQIFSIYKFIPRRSTGSYQISFRVTTSYAVTSFFASLIILPTRI